MLLQHWKVGHSQFIWNLRQNPKIVNIFAKIWDCKQDELLTSFDGASFHLPSEITKREIFAKFGIIQIKVILQQILNVCNRGLQVLM